MSTVKSIERGRHYSVAEANASLGRVRERLFRIMQLRARLKTLGNDLAAGGIRPSLDEASGLDGEDRDNASPEQARDAALFHAVADAMNDEIEALAEEGCSLKDVEVGLVDWPALHHGREVLLCWKLGETEVGHWHELGGGFSGRRPIAELVEPGEPVEAAEPVERVERDT